MVDISVIAACNERGCIGNQGGMPWRCPEDLHHFKETTTGSPIIGGRKTFESIGKTLPNRLNLILTRSSDGGFFDKINFEGPFRIARSIDHALAMASTVTQREEQEFGFELDQEVFFIGGALPFSQGIRRATTIYLSVIRDYTEGDTYLPLWDPESWDITDRNILQPNETVGDSVDFFTLERKPDTYEVDQTIKSNYKPVTPFSDEFRIRDLIANTDM